MSGLTPHALEMFKTHHGVATGRMLQLAGVGRAARQRLVLGGVLTVVHRCVYRIASAPDTLESRCAALCMAHPSGFVTGPTGGRLTRLRRMPNGDMQHLALPHGCNPGPIEGVIVRQTTRIAPSDVQRRHDGINVASAPRLAFDLGADLSPSDHASIVEQILHEQRCTFATMVSTARRLIHPNRPGSVVVARTLEARGNRAPAESHPELVLAEALRQRGIPVEPQTSGLRLPNGGSIRIDLAVPRVRWAVEIDVHPDHLLLDGTHRDKARDRQCHLIGWEVERVTSLDLADLDGIADELLELYRVRCRSIAA